MKAQTVTVFQSTIIYGKISDPIFERVTKFHVTESNIKNPEFAYRPLSSQIRELILLQNDYYGLMAFNMLYHLLHCIDRFANLERFEFQGQVEENSLIQFMCDLKYFKNLAVIKLYSKGMFFNPQNLLKNNDIVFSNIFNRGYKISKVTEDTSKFSAQIQLQGESLVRHVEYTYPNY